MQHAATGASSSLQVSTKVPDQNAPCWLPYAEAFTIALLAAASLWSVRPLLEEWGLFRAYNSVGLSHLASVFPLISMRPLHLTPSALQWLAGGGQVWGVGIVAALMLLARYFAVRWAVAPVLPPVQRWAFSTAGAVLIGWPALWLARFHPAQLSATLFFILLGLSIRLGIRNSLWSYISGMLSLCALLMVYQALALLVFTIPLLSYLWVPPGQSQEFSARIARSTRSCIMIGAGFILYGMYAAFIYTVMDGVYEVTMATSAQQTNPAMLLLGNISIAYGATFGRSPESLALLIALLCVAAAGPEDQRAGRYALLAVLAVFCLPLTSLVYINPVNLRDPERAMFPVACGALIVLLGLFMVRTAAKRFDFRYMIIATALLASSVVSAHNTRGVWDFQKDITTQITNLALSTRATHIILRDETGLLGDVYTFLGDGLSDAVASRGVEVKIELCTPPGVDRIHPDARRYPIATTSRCTTAGEQNPQTIEAVARMSGSKVVIGTVQRPTVRQ